MDFSPFSFIYSMKLLEYTFQDACPPRAFSTQRQGGVGEGAYDSFNITIIVVTRRKM